MLQDECGAVSKCLALHDLQEDGQGYGAVG
jgi:hypothetical protein